jgi:Tfp pilus assembly protein PilN
MLRTNLATRPFYNERAAHVAIGLAAAAVLAITVLNVIRIVTLSRHSTELSSRTGAEQEEAQRLTAEATRIRRTIDKEELELVVRAAQEANSLIDQRTFSWTEFFNRIESTLPPEVMLTSVRPSVEDGQTHVTMGALARRAEDVDEFIEKLEATGAFVDVLPASGDLTDNGLHRTVIEGIYTAVVEADAAEPAAKPDPLAGAKSSAVSSTTAGIRGAARVRAVGTNGPEPGGSR